MALHVFPRTQVYEKEGIQRYKKFNKLARFVVDRNEQYRLNGNFAESVHLKERQTNVNKLF
jgi:hypothetical protein